jgi:putative proteasome-type protease
MTYCVAICVKSGIVFCSDSRTNAGVDHISTYSKLYRFGREGDRQFGLLASGNLATTQAVTAQLRKDIEESGKRGLMTATTLDEAADYIGEVSVAKQTRNFQGRDGGYEANFLLGGQIHGSAHQVMLIYPQGNHITTSKDTPFLQIGESKYGKPILDRIINPDTSLQTAEVCALVSMDSTMRSNLLVGPPIELLVYETDRFAFEHYWRFDEDDAYLHELKNAWHARLRDAFESLPRLDWAAIERQAGQEKTES